ncbi:MAG: PAS domain S-box protein [Anaerolineae bacterium]|nr:PAS domain S-box protein [Anaerolineae bacterium]
MNTLSGAARLWQRTIEPFVDVPTEQRPAARFMAALFLSVALFLILALPLRYLTATASPYFLLRVTISLGSGLLVLLAYWLARRGEVRWAMLIVVSIGTTAIFATTLLAGQAVGARTFYYLIILILFAGLFLSVRATLSLALLFSAGMLVTPYITNISLSEVVEGPLVFNWVIVVAALLISTYRQRLEDARREQIAELAARYQSLIENTSDIVYSLNMDGTIRSINRTASILGGWSRDEIVGKHVSAFVDPADAEQIADAVNHALAGDAHVTTEGRFRTASGGRIVLEFKSLPVLKDGNLVAINGIARDVTWRKHEEERRMRAALETDRLALIGRFVSAVSHDFRTALATIETSRYLIERFLAAGQSERVPEKLASIQNSVAHFVDQLVNLDMVSALAAPRYVSVVANDLVKSVVDELAANVAGHGQTLTFQPAPDLPRIDADASQLRQAIKQVILNAINFTPAGGSITVRTTRCENDLAIEVRDTGVGIAPEHLPHIFDFFYRVDAARAVKSGGVGLGLSIVKIIAEAHDGSISATSEVGKGSVFTLTLPLRRQDS